MCGRVILTLSAKMIEAILNETFDVEQLSIDDYMPRYNVGPGQEVFSIIQNKQKNRAGHMKWQFVPTFARSEDDGYKFVNARAESIHEKKSFQDAFFKRRCIVLCNGFYEWQRLDNQKTPYFFQHHSLEWFALGGIWNPYIQKDGTKNYGLSLITTEANQCMAPIHHRMPVIIKKEDLAVWLDPNQSISTIRNLLKPVPDDYLNTYEVSSYVNKIQNNDIKCIERVS